MEIARLLHGIRQWWCGWGDVLRLHGAATSCRRAAAEPPQRLPLWQATLEKFFAWVWVAVALILASGLWMIHVPGGFKAIGLYVHLMFALGIVMMLIFAHVFFAPFRASDAFACRRRIGSRAARRWGRSASWSASNLVLGLLTVAVAILGRLFV